MPDNKTPVIIGPVNVRQLHEYLGALLTVHPETESMLVCVEDEHSEESAPALVVSAHFAFGDYDAAKQTVSFRDTVVFATPIAKPNLLLLSRYTS